MANYKMVTLKDPTTGEYLIPRVPRSLAYDVLDDGSIQAPIDMNADTLQGHPASDFLLKSEYTPTDLSAYMKTADANNAFATKSHTHNIAQITGLQTELDNLKTSGSEGKSLIASAITAKGVSTASDATFQQMATNIGNIQTGVELWNVYLDLAPWSYSTPYLPGKNDYIYTTAGTYQVPAYSIIALSFYNNYHYNLTNAIELHRNGQSSVDHFAILLTGNNARIEMYS